MERFAGIGNVIHKFKPPPNSKIFSLNSTNHVLGSICADVWKSA